MSFHLVFPAAGVGRRFGSKIPKQYCTIENKTIMSWTLSVFNSIPNIEQKIIALSPDDHWADATLAQFPMVQRVAGGEERFHSVINALEALSLQASSEDWVLVHDVARPCVSISDIRALMAHCLSTGRGAVLGHPMTDTVKYYQAGSTIKTLDRSFLWAVQTPQCFQLKQLSNALKYCLQKQLVITDEASAVEQLGIPIDIVTGNQSNIKLTHASDLALVEFHLKQQGRL